MFNRLQIVLAAASVVAVTGAGCSGGAVDLRQAPAATAAPVASSTPSATSAPVASTAPVASASPASPASAAPSTVPSLAPSVAPSVVPSIAPSVAPSASASSAAGFTFSPTAVVVAAQKSGCSPTSANFTVTEAGYAGGFTATSQDTTIATVAPTPGISNGFTVTSVTTTNGGAGTNIKVVDNNGNSALEPVRISICLP